MSTILLNLTEKQRGNKYFHSELQVLTDEAQSVLQTGLDPLIVITNQVSVPSTHKPWSITRDFTFFYTSFVDAAWSVFLSPKKRMNHIFLTCLLFCFIKTTEQSLNACYKLPLNEGKQKRDVAWLSAQFEAHVSFCMTLKVWWMFKIMFSTCKSHTISLVWMCFNKKNSDCVDITADFQTFCIWWTFVSPNFAENLAASSHFFCPLYTF